MTRKKGTKSLQWSLSLLIICTTVCSCTPSLLTNCSSVEAEDKLPINILSFFPCPSNDSIYGSCDYRTLTAVQLAVDEINEDENILSCFELNLVQLYSTDFIETDLSKYKYITNGLLNQPYHAILGPYDDQVSLSLSYIFSRLFNILQMSYSVTDTKLSYSDLYPRLYATVPTDVLLNQARQAVLNHFGWRTVAIFSSSTGNNIKIVQHLNRLLRKDGKFKVQMYGNYLESSKGILEMAKRKDIRIFLPIVSEIEARKLFCDAHRTGLTSVDHVWILPGIYDPQWWILKDPEEERNSNCTNSDIENAIQSTLYVDTLPFNVEARNDSQYVVSTVLERLNEPQINYSQPYPSDILHSKLLNAYDALHILALTWNATIYKLTTFKSIQEVLSIVRAPNDSTILGALLEESLEKVVSPYRGFTQFNAIFNRSNYGSALISQQYKNKELIYAIFNSSNELNPCTDNNYCGIVWKGGSQPTDVRGPTSLERAFHVFCFIYYSLVMIAGLVFAMLTYVWRNNKYYKATTVLFTVILNLACTAIGSATLMYTTASFIGYIQRNRTQALSPVCATSFVAIESSYMVIMAIVLVKNWRIYRIFHNPRNKTRRCLSTWFLSLFALLIVAPLTITLITFYSLYPPSVKDCPDTVLEVDCVCRRVHATIGWNLLSFFYFAIVIISLIALGLLNLRIQSFFRIEGQLATVVSFFTAIIGIVITNVRLSGYSFIDTFIAVNVMYMISLTIFLITINIPKIGLMRREIRREKTASTAQRLSVDYLDKCQEISKLKEHLYELEISLENSKQQTIG